MNCVGLHGLFGVCASNRIECCSPTHATTTFCISKDCNAAAQLMTIPCTGVGAILNAWWCHRLSAVLQAARPRRWERFNSSGALSWRVRLPARSRRSQRWRAGSTPARAATFAVVIQLARMRPCQGRCCRFETGRLHHLPHRSASVHGRWGRGLFLIAAIDAAL